MPAFPPRRPFCAYVSLARSITLRFVVGALAATTLLVAAPATLGAATLEGGFLEHSARYALPLDAGRHALYEPTSNHLVTVELDPLVHDADRLGVEAWGEDGRRLAVDYLGAFEGADGRQVAHWLSAVVVEGQGAGRHVFRVRSLDGFAIGQHTVIAIRDSARRGLPAKVNDQDTPKPDDDTGDILLVGPRGPGEQVNDQDTPKPDDDTGDILLAGKRLVGEQVNDQDTPKPDDDTGDILLVGPRGVGEQVNDQDTPKPDDDTGDILLGSQDVCLSGPSWFCARAWTTRSWYEAESMVEPTVWRLRVETAQVVQLTRGDASVEVFDHRGLRIAPEPFTDSGLFALPRGEYRVRVTP